MTDCLSQKAGWSGRDAFFSPVRNTLPQKTALGPESRPTRKEKRFFDVLGEKPMVQGCQESLPQPPPVFVKVWLFFSAGFSIECAGIGSFFERKDTLLKGGAFPPSSNAHLVSSLLLRCFGASNRFNIQGIRFFRGFARGRYSLLPPIKHPNRTRSKSGKKVKRIQQCTRIFFIIKGCFAFVRKPRTG